MTESPRKLVLILEDSPARIVRFERVFHGLNREQVEMTVHSIASGFTDSFKQNHHRLCCISLDHDLHPPGVAEPGDGMQVAEYLAEQPPACPIILHTSNGEQSRRMQGILEVAGWDVRLAGAIGEDWIEKDWVVEVKRAILGESGHTATMLV